MPTCDREHDGRRCWLPAGHAGPHRFDRDGAPDAGYWTPDHVIEYLAKRVGVSPAALRHP